MFLKIVDTLVLVLCVLNMGINLWQRETLLVLAWLVATLGYLRLVALDFLAD